MDIIIIFIIIIHFIHLLKTSKKKYITEEERETVSSFEHIELLLPSKSSERERERESRDFQRFHKFDYNYRESLCDFSFL